VPAIYLISVVSLVLVLSPLGASVKGAQRWIPVGPYQFQPAEIAKIAVVLGLAGLLSAAAKPMRWDRVARGVALVAVPSLLIFLQPDLGTMLTFGFIAIVMIFIAGATFRQMGALLVAAILVAVGVFQVGAVKEYQLVRLTAFLDSAADPLGPGYNQLQSEIAIGTGGLMGKGLFNGTQTNLRFVPEQSSDFIFTALGEQLGFIGSAFVLVLFGVIIWRILMAAVNARNRFGQLVAIGVAAVISFHVFVNVGMTVRLMPVTGLPLPFMSAGGTVFVAMSVALGLVHSVWIHRPVSRGEPTST
jgi:rod shape determining protein RodA